MNRTDFSPPPMPIKLSTYREKTWYSLQWLVKQNEIQNGKLAEHEKKLNWIQKLFYVGIGGSGMMVIAYKIVGII